MARESRPRAVVFDMDGVLVDSTPIHAEAFRRTMAARGLPFGDYGAIAGLRTDAAFRRLLAFSTPTPIDEADLAACVREKRQHFHDIAGKMAPIMPGAIETIRALHARGIVVGLATSGSRASMEAFLEASQLASLFSVTLCGEDVTNAKPAPDLYARAFAAVNVAPAEGLVVEDAAAGFEAATSAGARCVLFRSGEDTRTRYGARAHALIDELEHLIDVLSGEDP
jgi:beta-phosphoglucomutase